MNNKFSNKLQYPVIGGENKKLFDSAKLKFKISPGRSQDYKQSVRSPQVSKSKNTEIGNFFNNFRSTRDKKKSNSPYRFNNLFMKKEYLDTINITTVKNKYHSVKEYSYCEEKNAKFRDSMEDFSKIIDKYMNDSSKGFFSLYDGHGGSEAVIFVKERMPEILANSLEIHSVEDALTTAFKKVDEEVKSHNSENVGCTACIGLVTNEGGKKYFYCANVGDSKCLLINDKGANFITEEHRCSNSEEVNRVRQAGGIVFNGRVFGQLMLTRAIGDHAMKPYGVLNTPYISKHIVDSKLKYAIIASDGIWDVMDENSICTIINKYASLNDVAKGIVKEAENKGSRDNMSCIVLNFN